MTGLVTFLVFALLTALFVWLHVRRTARPARPARITCPRCGAAVSADAECCPGCAAPLGAYEVVTAREAAPAAAAAGPEHAIVRADRCVGCGACVDVCPEPGAIRLEAKLAVVNLDLCRGHGQCVAACPVGGIFLGAGEAVQRVEVPDLDVHFQSRQVPGLYVVGELGGRGLIKNAVNEGRLALEHVADSLLAPGARDDRDPLAVDVLIVGSGPAGLSAALEAHRRELSYAVLEQGSLSDTIARYPRRKVLFAEPLRMPLYGELWVSDASKESLLQVWQDVIARTGVRITTGQRVTAVTHDGTRFRVSTEGNEFRARRVVLAMGRRGTPRRLGVPGEELDKVYYDIVEMEAFAGLRMLVVGGGDSAIESAVGLAAQDDTPVTLSYRGDTFARAKQRNRDKLAAAIADGRIEAVLPSEVREIRRDVVVLEHDGRLRLVPNDVVVVRIGGEAPYPFLERIGVRIVTKELAVAPPGRAEAG